MKNRPMTPEVLARRIDCVLGRRPCELRLTNLRMLDVMNGRIIENAEIFVDNGVIIDAGSECRARSQQVLDLKGGLAVPGLIDAHVHIESSMLTPVRFARLVAPFGTTTVIADPHEIANVLGIDGIRFMLEEARKAEIDMFFMLSSCVPSTSFETAGAELKARDLRELLAEDRVLGLAEMMNVPGVLAKDPDLLAKSAMVLSEGMRIDGHSPLVKGAALSACAACGISSDHESSTPAELVDRLRRGVTVFMREGSAGKNVAALASAATPSNSRFLCLCTDDASPDDVYAGGHINHVVRRAVECGIDLVEALRMATINTAQHYGLRGKGVLAPGFDADIAVISDVESMTVSACLAAGRLIARDGGMLSPEPDDPVADRVRSSVRIRSVSEGDLRIATESGRARVIGLVPGNLITEHLVLDVQTAPDGAIDCGDNPGLVKLAVVERHHASGRIGLGLVRGLVEEGMAFEGAIASTVAHDSHNIVVAGDNDADMVRAIEEIDRMQGGLVLVRKGKVAARLRLEVAGLMSNVDARTTALAKRRFIEAAHSLFHVPEHLHPVMALSFLSLAVIPHLRVTDRGLFDVDAFAMTNLDPQLS